MSEKKNQAPDNITAVAFNSQYKIDSKVKQKPELREKGIILSVRHLKQFFFMGKGINRQKLKAVSDISFDIREGECLGIVGESGCGKTTTGRSIIRLYDITSGSVYYKGVRISAGARWNKKEIKWTKIRGEQEIKEIKEKLEKDIAALDKSKGEYYKTKDMTLWDAMIEMYDRYGYYKDGVQSVTMKGIEGLNKIQEIMTNLRENPPKEINGYKVLSFRDYQADTVKDIETGEVKPTGLPKSNVLYFDMPDNVWMCVRPSGTEPKIKFYYGVVGSSLEDADKKSADMAKAVTDMVEKMS